MRRSWPWGGAGGRACGGSDGAPPPGGDRAEVKVGGRADPAGPGIHAEGYRSPSGGKGRPLEDLEQRRNPMGLMLLKGGGLGCGGGVRGGRRQMPPGDQVSPGITRDQYWAVQMCSHPVLKRAVGGDCALAWPFV